MVVPHRKFTTESQRHREKRFYSVSVCLWFTSGILINDVRSVAPPDQIRRKILRRYIHQQTNQNTRPTIVA